MADDELLEVARHLVALWYSPKIAGLPRAERNIAISETRDRLVKVVQRLSGKTPTMADIAVAESPICPDCGTSLHLVCLECRPIPDGAAVAVPKLDDEAQRRDVEAYLDGDT